MSSQTKNALKEVIPSPGILFAHKLQAVKAAIRYGFPARKLKVIGVAGTKGKTTTCNLLTRILEEDGKRVAMYSTANTKIAGKESLNYSKMTMPPPDILQAFLAEAVKAGCEYAVIETSSHGLVQSRNWGINFYVVIITNLMPDHLDYHKLPREYRDTHLAMIGSKTRFLVVNGEEKHSIILREKVLNAKYYAMDGVDDGSGVQILSFGKSKDGEIIISDIDIGNDGSSFNLEVLKNDLGEFNIKLPGDFNVYNAVAAIGGALMLSVLVDNIKAALGKIESVPGRMEEVTAVPGQNFQIIVDYAHSPDSLKTFYEAITPSAKGRVIAVLGGTGDRDKTYRAKAGALADEFADIVVVTNEDPYSEDPEAIIDQVLVGVKNKEADKTLFRISDRREAIGKAVELAKKDDLVLVTGKGSEQWIVQGDKKIPWDDRKVAREALEQRFLK